MAKVIQALILVGGKAARLREDGVDVRLTKAFMMLAGRPILYWNLCTIHLAGIRRLLIAGDHVQQLYEADRVVRRLPYKFDSVDYFQDEGHGVHGLPYELRYLLEESFVFDCGHGVSTPSHYRKLMRAKRSGNVVFSGYEPHQSNLRQPVFLQKGRVVGVSAANGAIAHPIVADKQYARALLSLGFTIDAIIRHHCHSDALRYVKNSLPPEYDIAEEMQEAYREYRQYIMKYLLPYTE